MGPSSLHVASRGKAMMPTSKDILERHLKSWTPTLFDPISLVGHFWPLEEDKEWGELLDNANNFHFLCSEWLSQSLSCRAWSYLWSYCTPPLSSLLTLTSRDNFPFAWVWKITTFLSLYHIGNSGSSHKRWWGTLHKFGFVQLLPQGEIFVWPRMLCQTIAKLFLTSCGGGPYTWALYKERHHFYWHVLLRKWRWFDLIKLITHTWTVPSWRLNCCSIHRGFVWVAYDIHSSERSLFATVDCLTCVICPLGTERKSIAHEC
jgi:hypothetical protein